MLEHIHVENFRLFKKLDIRKIGQVNLIAGKNNCGKTTLLEALRLWANRNSLQHFDSTFHDLPRSRGDLQGGRFDAIFFNKNTSQPAEVLRIIEPDIVRVSINEFENSARVRLKNTSGPVPLKNFGEGMNRLLAIALGLVSAEDDMLLIDEIDLGLHHSVQPLMWEIVFQTAKRLNVQVFATTHRSDCVRSFTDMANKPEFTGMGNYLRLQKSESDAGTAVVDYNMEELETALELNLETR